MIENKNEKSTCKSVFKGGKNETTSKDFTLKWIELINRLENYKTVNFEKR